MEYGVDSVVALSAGSTGQLVEFKANGDAKGRYTIYQFQRLNGTNTYKYVPIGSWTDMYDFIAPNQLYTAFSRLT